MVSHNTALKRLTCLALMHAMLIFLNLEDTDALMRYFISGGSKSRTTYEVQWCRCQDVFLPLMMRLPGIHMSSEIRLWLYMLNSFFIFFINFSHLGCHLQSRLIYQQSIAYGCGMNFSGVFFFNDLHAAKYVFTRLSYVPPSFLWRCLIFYSCFMYKSIMTAQILL